MADIGSVLGGRYRLLELLGQGGMATIYRARDNQLERDVAVKVLRPEYGRDPDFFARFRQEAQSAASLNDRGVVAVYDYGTDPAGPYIVMELVDGEDLATIIRRSGALPPRQAARLAAQIARSIAAAHQRGFIHRDIKPGNVLVTRDGQVKVTDFGIARAVSEAQITLAGTTLGSVHYFSPEQARGEQANAESDIYSLGIVLFELLTGRRPWEGDSAAAVAMARLSGPVPSPSSIRAGIPAALEAIDQKALARDPAMRFGSASAMADALESFLASERGQEAGAAGIAGGVAAGAMAAGSLGAGAALGGAGGVPPAGPPTVVSGVARPNPGRLPYSDDAYADRPPAPPGGPVAGARRRAVVEEDDDSTTSPWVWASALLALLILAIVGFLIFRIMTGSGTRLPTTVTVPNFVGKSYAAAQVQAAGLGINVARSAVASSGQAVDTVLSQDPAAGISMQTGGTVNLTLAIGQQTVTVPDLRNRTEADAVNLIVSAGLTVGTRSEAFDPIVPVGAISQQDPGAGLVVTRGLPVNYTVSKGPQPTPTAVPTAVPTPTPTPPPPVPTPLVVGKYTGVSLATARQLIEQDHFTVGTVSAAAGSPCGYNPNAAPDGQTLVVSQNPSPGFSGPAGSKIDLVVSDPGATPSASCGP